eukprot:127690_1
MDPFIIPHGAIQHPPIECIAYIHSKRVCHLDISLENFLIDNVSARIKGDKIVFAKKEDIQIKLCDFGVAHLFDKDTDFQCTKFCGKARYYSPEVVRNETSFDAKKNDIWAMGICLFLMVFGCHPWNSADDTDELFVFVKSNSVTHLVRRWNIASRSCESKYFMFIKFNI